MKNHESNLQIACVRWFRLEYAALSKLLFAVPNGGNRSAITAHYLKQEGVVSGVSDLILLKPSLKYCGLCIEMKYGKGKQTLNQREWEKAVTANDNYAYKVCNSFESFRETINKYLNNEEI